MYRADHGNMTHMIPSTREINPQNETHIHRLNSNQTKSYRLKRSLNTILQHEEVSTVHNIPRSDNLRDKLLPNRAQGQKF